MAAIISISVEGRPTKSWQLRSVFSEMACLNRDCSSTSRG